MTETYSFGEWLSQQRKALDMTQRELAVRSNCALATVKKIERDERRPSRELAAVLADVLQIPVEAQKTVMECARGLRAVDVLVSLQRPKPDERFVSSTAADLPASATPLIGRTSERGQVARLIEQPACRLLTLVGSGGVGKTRLAIETARAQCERFADGAVFVPLGAITDSSLFPTAIAQSLHLTLSGAPEPLLFAYLKDKTMLLVLDNCEQLVENVNWLSDLLANAPKVKLLATSRERLQLAEEWIYDVPVLDELQALDLFNQTAQRLNAQFQADEQPMAVSTVCKLVENLPLAIELAASWTPFMSCKQIVENIQRDIDFLTANVRNIPARHRSIRAVFDHSWHLLSSAEQEVMMRLSVFRSGWTVDEAEPIAGATLLMLRALVEKSLIRAAGNERYDLHELIRQYVADKLRAAGQEGDVRRQHCEVYLKLANRLDVQLHGPDAIPGFARLEREQDNFRAALTWALAAGEVDQALRLVNNLFHFWWRRGYWQEGERWITVAVSQAGDKESIPLCRALYNLIPLYMFQARFSEMGDYSARAVSMARRLEAPETLGDLWIVTAMSSFMMQTKMTQVQAVLDESQSILQKWDDPRKWATIAMVRFIYGDLLRQSGYYAETAAQYQQSLDIYRQIGNVDMIAYPLGNLGRLALQVGRLQEAYDLIAESVAISRAVGNRVNVGDWLHQLGKVALYLGDTMQAEACLEEALALHEEVGGIQVHVLALLGHVALARGDVDSAAHYLHDSLSAAQKAIQHVSVNLNIYLQSNMIEGLLRAGLVATAQGIFERAVTLFGNAERLRLQSRCMIESPLQAEIDAALTTVHSRLSQAAFDRAWEAGQTMSLDQVLAYARET